MVPIYTFDLFEWRRRSALIAAALILALPARGPAQGDSIVLHFPHGELNSSSVSSHPSSGSTTCACGSKMTIRKIINGLPQQIIGCVQGLTASVTVSPSDNVAFDAAYTCSQLSPECIPTYTVAMDGALAQPLNGPWVLPPATPGSSHTVCFRAQCGRNICPPCCVIVHVAKCTCNPNPAFMAVVTVNSLVHTVTCNQGQVLNVPLNASISIALSYQCKPPAPCMATYHWKLNGVDQDSNPPHFTPTAAGLYEVEITAACPGVDQPCTVCTLKIKAA